MHRSVPTGTSPAPPTGFLALALLPALAGAQEPGDPPAFLVSTTSSGAAGAVAFLDDGDLARTGGGAAPRATWTAGHWIATLGFAPGDVDALAAVPGVPPGRHDALAFSLLSNEGGALDGDVLTVAPGGGLAVLVAEEELTAALGVPGASVDVDALAWDEVGRLAFSLQSDLAGTVLGDVRDGDVLRLEPGGGVARVLTEDEVAAAVKVATGASATPGDVQGLAYDGAVPLVAVQSPSAWDGAVVACGAVPAVVLDEDGVGLGGVELDALARLHPEGDLPTFSLAPQVVVPGEVVQAGLAGGVPGSHVVLLTAGAAGYADATALPGFGGLFLDPNDPWFLTELATGLPGAVVGGEGTAGGPFPVPGVPGGPGVAGAPGWTVQPLELGTLRLLAPFRVSL